MILIQKLGMAAISRETTDRVESSRVCSFTAEITPKGTPISTEARVPPSAKVKVTGIFAKRSEKTRQPKKQSRLFKHCRKINKWTGR